MRGPSFSFSCKFLGNAVQLFEKAICIVLSVCIPEPSRFLTGEPTQTVVDGLPEPSWGNFRPQNHPRTVVEKLCAGKKPQTVHFQRFSPKTRALKISQKPKNYPNRRGQGAFPSETYPNRRGLPPSGPLPPVFCPKTYPNRRARSRLDPGKCNPLIINGLASRIKAKTGPKTGKPTQTVVTRNG